MKTKINSLIRKVPEIIDLVEPVLMIFSVIKESETIKVLIIVVKLMKVIKSLLIKSNTL